MPYWTEFEEEEEPIDTALSNILRDHCLSPSQLARLNTTMNAYLAGEGNTTIACVHRGLYLGLKAANKKIGFCLDTARADASNGLYETGANTIYWQQDWLVDNIIILSHEMFHVYQDVHYNGTSQYAINGYPNMEFEQGLFKDLTINGSSGAIAMGSAPETVRQEYKSWLTLITNGGTTYPKQFSDFGLDSNGVNKYYHFLDLFYQHSSYSGHGVINTSLQPSALLNILSTTNCK